MEILLFIITISLIIWAYLSQVIKLLISKNSFSVSPSSYFVGFLANISLYINSENYYMQIVTITGVSLSLITFFIILYFKEKIKFDINNILKSKPLIFGLFASIFGVFGVSQGVACIQNKTHTTQVSYISYIVWILYSSMSIILATSTILILANLLSLTFYFYIVYTSFIKKC